MDDEFMNALYQSSTLNYLQKLLSEGILWI